MNFFDRSTLVQKQNKQLLNEELIFRDFLIGMFFARYWDNLFCLFFHVTH